MKNEQLIKTFRIPLIIAASVFSLGMVLIWPMFSHELDTAITIVGALYAFICFAFLIFQIVAFIRCHLHYDEDIEAVKYKVFQIEKE